MGMDSCQHRAQGVNVEAVEVVIDTISETLPNKFLFGESVSHWALSENAVEGERLEPC